MFWVLLLATKLVVSFYVEVLFGINVFIFVGVCIRPMRLRPMWPMYGTYIATLLGLAQVMENHSSNMVSAA
jgi:hypothetical protein